MHPAILNELKKRWNEAKANAGSVHVAEYAEADWIQGRTTGDPVKVWIFNGDAPEETDAGTKQVRKTKAGGLFEQAGFRFCIDPNEKKILVEFVTGPLIGSGKTYKMSGDEQSLLVDADGPTWGV